MPNEEVLSARKSVIVLAVVVGCFAVLWPKMLHPFFVGNVQSQIEPNQFDKAAGLKQERPAIRAGPMPNPAIFQRGRAIQKEPTPPSQTPIPMMKKMAEGRVGKELSGYYQDVKDAPPIPGVRPPMGGAGGVIQNKTGSMSVLMPMYTICIIVFFAYTIFKILFRKSNQQPDTYINVGSDQDFRRRVFECHRNSRRSSPETKLGDEELDLLKARLAETERAMERIVQKIKGPLADQEPQENGKPYTNGSVPQEQSPKIIAQTLINKEPTPAREKPVGILENDAVDLEETLDRLRARIDRIDELNRNVVNDINDSLKPERIGSAGQIIDEIKSDKIDINENVYDNAKFIEDERKEIETYQNKINDPSEEMNINENEEKENGTLNKKRSSELLAEAVREKYGDKVDITDEELISDEDLDYDDDEIDEKLSENKKVNEQVDSDKTIVKVLGMEMTAHCETGEPWGDRPLTPSLTRRPHQDVSPENVVSAIYLEGDIPQQSRILVADSESHTEHESDGKDSPVVLSGKVTLSLINDSTEGTPERETYDLHDEGLSMDEDEPTPILNADKLIQKIKGEDCEISEEEIEEEEEEEAEDADNEEEEFEVEEIEEEQSDTDEDNPVVIKTNGHLPNHN